MGDAGGAVLWTQPAGWGELGWVGWSEVGESAWVWEWGSAAGLGVRGMEGGGKGLGDDVVCGSDMSFGFWKGEGDTSIGCLSRVTDFDLLSDFLSD